MMSASRREEVGQQKKIDFGERRQLMRALQVDPNVKHLLRVLDDHAAPGNACFLNVSTIAAEMCVSVSTAGRAIRVAKEEELILVERRAASYANDYVLRWPQIRDRVQGQPAACEAELLDPGASAAVDQFQFGQPDRTEDSHSGQVDRIDPVQFGQISDSFRSNPSASSVKNEVQFGQLDRHKKSLSTEEENEEKPPSTLLSPPAPTWEMVVVVLNELKVTDRSCVTEARTRGCSPAEVLRLLDACRRRGGAGCGPGCVVRRLRAFSPGDDPRGGWWPPDSCAVDVAASRPDAPERAARQGLAVNAELEAIAERFEERRAAQAAREAEFGRLLDALPEVEVQGLLDTVQLRLYRRPRGGRHGSQRAELLRKLEARERVRQRLAVVKPKVGEVIDV